MSGIAVKVSVKKLIDALTAKIKANKALIAAYEKAQKDYEKAQEKYEASIPSFVKKGATFKDSSISTNRWDAADGFAKITLTYLVPKSDLPAEPEREKVEGYNSQLSEQVTEMENAVRLLQMTEDETVNASTYKSVSKYL